MAEVFHHADKHRKFAFTLAEVLITLGIIGIVAVLILPGAITNYKKKVIVERLKANYSIFSQVINSAKQDYGDISSWDLTLSSIDFANKYILPYLSTSVQKTKWYKIQTLRNVEDGINGFLFWSTGRPVYMLGNGVNFSYQRDQGLSWIVIDINGSKGPNVMGTDGFAFVIDASRNQLIPYGFGLPKETLASKNVSKVEHACAEGVGWRYYQGGYCAALIMAEGWKIPDDYPLR